MSADKPEWYYAELDEDGKDKVRGPVDISGLRSLYEQSSVTEFTFFWREGQTSWVALKDLPLYNDISNS